MEYLQAHLRPVVLLLHHQVQIQPPLSQIPLVLILHLFKTDYQLNDIFPVEITMKNIEIIGRTGTIPFLEMKIQNSYTLEQGILKEFNTPEPKIDNEYYEIEEQYFRQFGHGVPREMLPDSISTEQIKQAMKKCILSKKDNLFELLGIIINDNYLY